MQRELNDLGGAKELALYRLKIAKKIWLPLRSFKWWRSI